MKGLRSASRIAMITCIAASVTVLGAQEPRRLAQPDSVPVDLAAALMTTGSVGSEPQLLVGTLPEWFAARIVLPSGARILGAAFQGMAVVGVASIPGTASESLIAGVHRDLLSHGWKDPPAPTNGGFRPAPNADVSRVMMCQGDDQLLTVVATPHHGINTTITYRLGTYSVNGPCRTRPLPQYARPPFPILVNPPSTPDPQVMFMCEQSVYGASSTATAFRAPLSAERILDYYSKQLADSGWTTDGRNASIVGRTWTRPDSTGAPVRLSLIVTTPPRDSTCHEVNMQLREVRKP